MSKFIISDNIRYLVVAESLEEAQFLFRSAQQNGNLPEDTEYLDGSTTYEPTEENA